MTDEVRRWEIDSRVGIASVVIAAAGLVIAGAAVVVPIVWDARQKVIDRQREDARLAWEEQQRQQQAAWAEQQRQQQEAAERPILKYLSYREENGYYLLSLAHDSKTRTANIEQAVFRITAESELDRIRRVVAEKYSGGGFQAANPCDDVFFREGKWVAGHFVFGAKLSCNIPPGPANDLRLAILDPRFAGYQFVGELEVHYSAGTEYTPPLHLQNVTIKGRRAGK